MANVNLEGFRHPSIQKLTCRPKLLCSMLDKSFGPCLRPGHIIEIVGEAGSGKTQFALHLSARSVINASYDGCSTMTNDIPEHEDRKTLYLSTEGPFPVGRLRQMIEGMGESKSLMDNIFIENITCIEELMECVEKKVLRLAKQVKLALIVIDSIAAPIRAEFEMKESRERTLAIHRLGSVLNSVARKINVPIVILNQVSSAIDTAYHTFGRNVVPCFGLSFANYVHTGIFLARTELVIKEKALASNEDSVHEIKPDTRLRTATIDFSPLLPSGDLLNFIIDVTGPRGVSIKQNV